ncbi:MAG: hypothetical protein OEQ53_21110, partial [Saprospiraceae bacterium]|nr:hypothetical protein [Saprospiraceae bacterium]
APYGAIVWQVSSGPNSGKLVWMMGPCTFTDLDDRPAGDDHSSDWRDNVMSLMEDIGPIEYWRRNDDLSIVVDGPPKPIVRVRFSNVIRGQSHRVNGMFGKIRDAIKEMEGENTWGVYLNEFQQGYETGRHFATSTGMDSWSELDEGSGTEFSEAYIKAHGAGAWSTFNQELREVFSNTWDEYWVIRPDLSGVSLED